MKPIDFRCSNVTIISKAYGDIAAFQGDGQIVHCWRMTLIERLKCLLTGRVYVGLISTEQPPMWLCVKFPFVIKKEGENK